MKIRIFALLLAVMLLTACGKETPQSTASTSGSTAPNGQQPSNEAITTEGLDASEPENDTPQSTESESSNESQSPSISESEDVSNEVVSTQEEETASYEEHLGALTLFALSMEYPFFQL